MDKNQSDSTEEVLNLTLEILLLLTGENYFFVKMPEGGATNNGLQLVEGSWRAQTDVQIPLPHSLIHELQNKQRILELTKKIIELLTREVPIRCQDVTVHFSMEEWEYLEGHKEMYKGIVVENRQTLTSLGLPKRSTNEDPPMRFKEEQCRRILNPEMYTPTDHMPQNHSVYFNEGPVSFDGRSLIETTQQYPCTHVKEEPLSCNGETLTNQSIDTPTDIHTQQYAYTYVKLEPSLCERRGFKDHTNTPFDQLLQCLPHQIKDEPLLQDGESPTDGHIYAVKDHIQQCPSLVNEEPVLCGGGNLICKAPYPSTHAKAGTNPPETQRTATDNIIVQFYCSECKKCFLSMAELVSHQEIHIADNLLQGQTHVSPTAVVHALQVPPVKHKLLSCSKCERTFYTKSSLVGHMKTHWGKVNHVQNKTFKCDKCEKCFSSKSLLHLHSRTHCGDRPYACSTCGDRFMRTSDLGRHQRKHR